MLASSNGYGPSAGSVGTAINAGILRVGNNAALSTGDVSVAGNITLQSGANGLVVNNNLVIGSGITASVDTQGNTLTLAGLVSESAPSGSLAVIGSGTLSDELQHLHRPNDHYLGHASVGQRRIDWLRRRPDSQ